MTKIFHSRGIATLCIVMASLAGCASGGKNSELNPLAVGAASEQGADYMASLDSIVRRDLRSESSYRSPETSRFVSKKPSFYREYVEYPEGVAYETEMRERESLSAPYQALVRVSKIRYATAIRSKRDDARRDTRYIKSRGVETISYEYRSGKWYRMGSFFVADSSEVQVAGEWQALDTAKIAIEAPEIEEERTGGFWNRMKIWQR